MSNNIWFTSDLHFSHKNLIRGSTEWTGRLEQCRNFDTVEEHDQVLTDNINKIVKPEDILYCLGDFSMNGRESIWRNRRNLNVKTLHLILGNHDNHIRSNAIIKTDVILNDQGKPKYVNAQNLFTTVNELLHKKINGQNMTLCHYGMTNWWKASKGAWMLYGHSHGRLPDYGRESDLSLYKSKDVGIDTHPEFRPYHFDELAALFNSNKYIDFKGDHHE